MNDFDFPEEIGGWRQLYLKFLADIPCLEICELGAGTHHFLDLLSEANRRVAVDIGDKYAEQFVTRKIEFYKRDLEEDLLHDLGKFDVVVCSDVFEHLRSPTIALKSITEILKPNGILLSHVPNEFQFSKTLKVMLGHSTSLYFHRDHEEWTDPHVRRFTDRGYNKFLESAFLYNLKITDLRYNLKCKLISALGIKVPYALEGGPTYISTNSVESFKLATARKLDLKNQTKTTKA